MERRRVETRRTWILEEASCLKLSAMVVEESLAVMCGCEVGWLEELSEQVEVDGRKEREGGREDCTDVQYISSSSRSSGTCSADISLTTTTTAATQCLTMTTVLRATAPTL